MVSFELSTMNIVLTVAVVALFIFFITLLMKLNPSTETKERHETEIEFERPKPLRTLPIMPQKTQTPPQKPQPARIQVPRVEVPRVAEKPLVTVSPTIEGPSTQTKQKSFAQTLYESKENPRPDTAAAQAKTGLVDPKKDCIHHFGYLHTFPKNSPIPDECFGCEKIVDCLVNKNTSLVNKNTNKK